uniref:Uncharacterized protein n=1 Tax=Anguilla anguilla TaxID=7936 RepID=A0A0E9VJK6_ANGAN
MSDVELEK